MFALCCRQRFGNIVQGQTWKSKIDTLGHEGGSRLVALGHRSEPAPQRVVHDILQAEPLLSPHGFKLSGHVRVQCQGGPYTS